MTLNKFTMILRSRGWTISDACKRWGIRDATYYDRTNNPKMHSQLEDMCKGIPDKMEGVK